MCRQCGLHQGEQAATLDGYYPMIMGLAEVSLVKTRLCIWITGSEPLLLSTSNWSIALLEAAGPPSFVPLLTASLAELVAPLAEH